jgi:hypothetical protein
VPEKLLSTNYHGLKKYYKKSVLPRFTGENQLYPRAINIVASRLPGGHVLLNRKDAMDTLPKGCFRQKHAGSFNYFKKYI